MRPRSPRFVLVFHNCFPSIIVALSFESMDAQEHRRQSTFLRSLLQGNIKSNVYIHLIPIKMLRNQNGIHLLWHYEWSQARSILEMVLYQKALYKAQHPSTIYRFWNYTSVEIPLEPYNMVNHSLCSLFIIMRNLLTDQNL